MLRSTSSVGRRLRPKGLVGRAEPHVRRGVVREPSRALEGEHVRRVGDHLGRPHGRDRPVLRGRGDDRVAAERRDGGEEHGLVSVRRLEREGVERDRRPQVDRARLHGRIRRPLSQQVGRSASSGERTRRSEQLAAGIARRQLAQVVGFLALPMSRSLKRPQYRMSNPRSPAGGASSIVTSATREPGGP